MDMSGPADPRQSWRSEFPFASRWHTTSGGHRMHYIDEGRAGATTTLCIHGNPTWSFYWRKLISATAGHRRILAPDHIGMGLSDKPDAETYPYTLRQRIDDLEALWMACGSPRFDLVAYDWGGPIGLGLALRHPDKVGRLTLLNTAAYTDTSLPLRIAVCRWGALGQFLVRGLNGFAGSAVYLATTRRGGLPRTTRAGLLFPYPDWKSRVAVHEFVRDIPLKPGHRSWATLLEIERGLVDLGRNREIQLLWGERDFCFHNHFLWRFVEFWPHARVDRLPEAGHYVLEDAPEEAVGRILEFQGLRASG